MIKSPLKGWLWGNGRENQPMVRADFNPKVGAGLRSSLSQILLSINLLSMGLIICLLLNLLLFNFSVPILKNGIKRLVNN